MSAYRFTCCPCSCPCLQSLVFFRDEDVHLKELLARWTMAFPKVRIWSRQLHKLSGLGLSAQGRAVWTQMVSSLSHQGPTLRFPCRC